MALTKTLVRATLVAALGGLLFGFDTAVIAGTTSALRQLFGLSPAALGLTVSIALWGTVAGSLLASLPADRWGRRESLQLTAVLFLLSALGCASAWNWPALVTARFIGGLGIGAASVLGPMYIAEIAPARWRGRLVGIFQFNVVAGILLAYFSNYVIGLFGLGAAEWRWKLGVAALPALAFLLALIGIPSSPRWLAKQGQLAEARQVLQLVGEEDVDRALADIEASLRSSHGPTERLFQWKYRVPVLLAVSLAMFNQLSGINAILYYLNDIFERAGFSKVSGDLQAVIVGLTNLVFTVLAMSVIDRVGRRTLLLVGSVGTAACLFGVAWIFLTGAHERMLLLFLVGYIAAFAFSQGAVIWVYLSEIFPTPVRAQGQSLGSFTHWFMNALISWTFPVMASYSGGYPFIFFGGMMVLQFFAVLLFYPETKGLTLEQMQRKLGIE